MPVARELKVVYGTITLGASTARQITEYLIHEEGYESGYFECEFVTTAATEAAWETEINLLRDEFRKPRLDLVVTLGSTDFLTRKHSDNTALDTNPVIIKDGDPADTGRSRHFRIRIEYGLPADNVSTDFRRWSDVSVSYSPSRQRTVTVSGVYTAESTEDNTAAFAQYREKISAYLSTVTSGIDSNATWETIGEPEVTRNETDKVVEFEIVAKEILDNQATNTLNDADIVDPVMTIERHRLEPGDSNAGGFTASPQGGGGPGSTQVAMGISGPGQTTEGNKQRPTFINISYECGIDKDNVVGLVNLKNKWQDTIRGFLIDTAKLVTSGGVILLDEKPNFDPYENRISATMQFIAYIKKRYEQHTTISIATESGKRLRAVWDEDEFSYYEFPGPAVRLATSIDKYKEVVTKEDPNQVVLKLMAGPNSGILGLGNDWMFVSQEPTAVVLKQGLVANELIVEVTVETVARFRKKKTSNVQNFGGVTGAGLSG